MRKKIAVIGANEPLLSHYRQARQLGYEIHSFAWEEGAVCKPYADFFYPISFTEKEKILAICREVGIQGILSFTLESALPTVNYIAYELNLPGNPPSCTAFTANKYTMREQLKRQNVRVPEYRLITSADDLEGPVYKFPLIVKPVDSGGSRGVTKVYDTAGLKEAYKRALGYSGKGEVLVEQYIDGREFSIEYISHRGVHYPVAITDKVTTGEPYCVELEHHQPAEITAQQQEAIFRITEQMLSALEIYSSASHTEIRLDSKGDPYIIEMGARMGGDMIGSELVRLSTGYDYVKATIELACGDFTRPEITESRFSGIYFLSADSSYVGPYLSHPDKHPEIVEVFRTSEELKDLKESADRSGYVIYRADKKFSISKEG